MFLGEVSRAWVYKVRPWDQEATLGEEEEMEWGKLWHLGVEQGRRAESLSDKERLEKLLVPLLVSDKEESEEEIQGLQEKEEEQRDLKKSEKNVKDLKNMDKHVHGLKKSQDKVQGLKKSLENVQDLKESESIGRCFRDVAARTVTRESDHQNSMSQPKRAKSSRRLNHQGTKSEYEKLRDANIAERRKAFKNSGLLEEIAKYKKDFLGKSKKSSCLEGDRGSNTEKQVKGSQCKICQAQVPSGVMVLHKKYFHAKIKEPVIRSATKARTPKELLQSKCPQCNVVLNREVLALHMKHYHTPAQDITEPGPLTTHGHRPARGQQDMMNIGQQGLAGMEKMKRNGQAPSLVRKMMSPPMGEKVGNIDTSKQRNIMVLEPKHGYVLPRIPRVFQPNPSQDPVQEPQRVGELLQEKKFLAEREPLKDMKIFQYQDTFQDSFQNQELTQDLHLDQECARERSISTSEVSLPPAPSCSTSILAMPSPTGILPPPPLEEETVSCPLCADLVVQKLMTTHIQHFHCETKVGIRSTCGDHLRQLKLDFPQCNWILVIQNNWHMSLFR